MPRFRKVTASPGTDEVNVGTERFRVPPGGKVEVPTEAVEALTKYAGFTDDGEEIEVPDGLVAVRHPEGASCSWGGHTFEAKHGFVLVPCAAVADLMSHGFVGVDDVTVEGKPLTLRVPKSGE